MADYDAIIIGTGQAGPALARKLVAASWKVVVIERKFFGGTCVNTGCTHQDAGRERLCGVSGYKGLVCELGRDRKAVAPFCFWFGPYP